MLISVLGRLGFSSSATTLCLFVLLLLILALYVHRRYYTHNARFLELAGQIPGPTCYPLIGSAYVFGTDAEDIMQNVADMLQKYPNVSKYWLGPMLYICVQDAKDVEVVLSSNKLITKSHAYTFMRLATGEGILASSGYKWKKHRKALKPTFSYPVYESYISVFNSKMNILTKVLENQVNKTYFDISPFFHNLVYDILWETIMTTEADSLSSGQVTHFAEPVNRTVAITLCRMFKPWLFPDWTFNETKDGRLANSYVTYLHDHIKQVIHKKNSDKVEGKTKFNIAFLDYTVGHAQENGFNDEDILNETCSILFAGFDSTSSALSFLCCILSRRFDVQERIVEEIEQVFGSLEEVPFTYQHLQSLEYLERVVKESLRLLTIIPFISRQITEDVKLPSGYTLPNGSGVVVPFFSLHRDPKHYPNPNVFDPDNFLPERVAQRPSFSFCPFSAGPRDCIGRKFAMLQLKACALSIVRKFWILPTDFRLDLAAKMNLHPVNGVRVGLRKRTTQRPDVFNVDELSKKLVTNVEYFNILFKNNY